MTIHAGIKAIPALSLGCYIRVANVTPSVHLTVLVAIFVGPVGQLCGYDAAISEDKLIRVH